MARLTSEERCVKEVWGDGWGGHQCSRRGVIKYEDKLYCKQHNPQRRVDQRDYYRRKCEAERLFDTAAANRNHARREVHKFIDGMGPLQAETLPPGLRELVDDLIAWRVRYDIEEEKLAGWLKRNPKP